MATSKIKIFLKELKKRSQFYWITLILASIIIGCSAYLSYNFNLKIVEKFNNQVQGISKSSTSYLVNNFVSYLSESSKYQKIRDDFLKENTSIDKFQIFDTYGNVLYDSQDQNYQQKIKDSYLKLSKKSETSFLYQGKKIRNVISPNFAVEANNDYSVLYVTSLTAVDKEIVNSNLAIMVVAFLMIITAILIGIIFINLEEGKVEREEKRRLESAESQREELMMLAAHNLRTPLTNIEGNILLLREMLKLSAKEKQLFRAVTENARKMGNQIEEIIAITSVIGAPESRIFMEDVKIVETVNDVKKLLKEQITDKNIMIEAKIDEVQTVHANKKYFTMILRALVDNAVKFSPEKGIVKIEANRVRKNVAISVVDSGVGIKSNEIKRIYEGFHRADGSEQFVFNYEGFGLGLYMTKTVVEFMGGNVSVESQEGNGATFTITLPEGAKAKELAKE